MSITNVVVDSTDKLGEVSLMINESYNRDIEKTELKQFKELVRTTRKLGFPFVCSLTNEEDRILWAAKLLVSVCNTWALEDMPGDFKLLLNSKLLDDAEQLVANSVGNYRQLLISRPTR